MGGVEFGVISVPVEPAGLLDALSATEREVVHLALSGLSNAQIGKRRRTSPRTIANQLAAAYRKLGVRSRAELAALIASGAER